jgi:hypothetical protein
MDILEQIKQVSALVSDRDIVKLRLEEELLISLITKNGVSFSVKQKAFDRIAVINKQQLKILGQ